VTAWRCEACLIAWPKTKDYVKCPQCEADTYNSGSDPITESEARHLAFEAHYQRREKAREEQMAGLEAAAAAVQSPPDPPKVESD